MTRPSARLWVAVVLLILTIGLFRSIARSHRATANSRESMLQQEALQQFMRISSHFSGFLRDRARLPRDLDELLKDRSPALAESDLIDPWGTPLRYEIIEPQPMWFRLSSAGPDRAFGTGDDLVHQVGGKNP